jgi:hypothetical protein
MTMRTRKLWLVASIISAMPVLSPAGVVAQSEAPLDAMGASFWTGTGTFIEGSFTPPLEETEGPGYAEVLGIGRRIDVAADDPRITGTMTQVQNARVSDGTDPAEGHTFVIEGTARIDNDEGAWVGTWTSYGADRVGGEEWYVLEGEGAYEGLTVVFSGDVDAESPQGPLEGVIVPFELPAVPEPAPPHVE